MGCTNFTVGSDGMIMKSGFDTGYFVRSGEIFKNGNSTGLSVSNNGMIKKDGSDTGYVIGGGSITKDSDKGYSIDWMFN